MSLSTEQRFNRINDGLLRLEAVIDLASAIANDEFDGPDGVVDDLLDEIGSKSMLFPAWVGMDDLVDVCRAQIGDESEIGGILLRRNILGIAVKFATPVRDYKGRKGSTAFQFSWGRYYTAWVYAESYEQAWERGFQWVEVMATRDREATK